MLLDDLDIENVNANHLDEYAKNGGLMPAGKYHARLDVVKEATANNGNTGQEFHFTVLAGPFTGREVKDTLWSGEKDGAKNRQLLFASHLGLLKRNGAKLERVPGKESFRDAEGTEVIIDVKHEPYTNKDGKPGIGIRLTYAGVLSLNDPAAKNVPRAKPAAGGGAPTASPAATKKANVAEL